MSESAVTDFGEQDPRHETRAGRNVFQRIALYVRQVVSELKLVVYPSKEEHQRYMGVVLGFVAVMMLIVFGLDTLFNWVAAFTFGRGADPFA